MEVKASGTIRSSDFKGLRFLKDSLGSRFRRGVVLYTGGESIPFGEKLEALPVSRNFHRRTSVSVGSIDIVCEWPYLYCLHRAGIDPEQVESFVL